MIGGSHIAALSPDWVTRVISSSASPMLTPLDWKCEADIQAAIERRRQNAIAKRQGNIAVVPIRGVITPRPTIWEAYGFATSVDTIVALTRAAVQDPNVKAVVQAYDSPGGSVFGVEEGFAELLSLRGDTPIIAVAEHLMASAAYWLASAADEIVAAPSALTGSVGVMMLHLDYSKALEAEGVSHKFIYAGENKVEGNPLEPLSEETQAYYQAEVDAVYRQFVGDITRGRNFLTTKVVRGEAFGQGRVLNAADAKDAGMIDQVRTLRDTLIAYGIEVQGSGARALAPQRRRRALALMEKSHSI
jgi:signal peptide peptidase SppA